MESLHWSDHTVSWNSPKRSVQVFLGYKEHYIIYRKYSRTGPRVFVMPWVWLYRKILSCGGTNSGTRPSLTSWHRSKQLLYADSKLLTFCRLLVLAWRFLAEIKFLLLMLMLKLMDAPRIFLGERSQIPNKIYKIYLISYVSFSQQTFRPFFDKLIFQTGQNFTEICLNNWLGLEWHLVTGSGVHGRGYWQERGSGMGIKICLHRHSIDNAYNESIKHKEFKSPRPRVGQSRMHPM